MKQPSVVEPIKAKKSIFSPKKAQDFCDLDYWRQKILDGENSPEKKEETKEEEKVENVSISSSSDFGDLEDMPDLG